MTLLLLFNSGCSIQERLSGNLKKEKKMNEGEFYQAFKKWALAIAKEENPGDQITAFNFGLFETSQGYSIYLIGSKVYDEKDDDWACTVDFTPKKRYFEIPSKIASGKKWDVIESEVIAILKKFISSTDFKQTFFSRATAITVGFDDGNLTRVK